MKRTLPCFLVGLMSWTLPGPAQAAAANQARKPNIIVVITDNQGFGDLGCHGHPYLKTPNLDRLHPQSPRLTDFHVSPTCSPTRAAPMTGRAPFKNGITQDPAEKHNVIKQHPEVAGKMLAAYDSGGLKSARSWSTKTSLSPRSAPPMPPGKMASAFRRPTSGLAPRSSPATPPSCA